MPTSPHVQCLLTFDYELFHGRNHGSAHEVLFAPTERLFDLCDALDVRVTFFPDVCCVWWHADRGETELVDRFEDQMRDALRRGHDVQLHVHPHWLACERVDGRFVLDASRMYPSQLGWGDGADEAPAVIRRAVKYLDDLLQPVQSSYRCTAFRAASLVLQPQEHELLRALTDAGIELDCSITPGVYSVTDSYRIDYRDVPRRANWFMAPPTGLAAAERGILEVPIGTFRTTTARRLEFLLRRLRSARAVRRGDPMARATTQSKLASLVHLLRANLYYLRGDPWLALSCDTKGYDVDMLVDGLRDFVDRHSAEGTIAVSMIGHPKLMFEPELARLRGFVERTRALFGDRLAFTTTTQTLATLGAS